MSETQEGFPPLMFLQALRTAFPQFAQRSREGHGYAQQDAEEAWSQIVSQLRSKLKIKDAGQEAGFIDKYMAGFFESEMKCDEPAAEEGGEQAVESTDSFLKLNCHITGEINHLRDGLVAGLSEQIEKRSEVLGRDAMYTKTSRVSRLPKYLTVHFVRFDWRRSTNKKAKIMRKVTFQHELDAVEFCTEDLKNRYIPVRDRIREIRKDEEDIERARKRQKRRHQGEDDAGASSSSKPKDDEKKKDGKKGEAEKEEEHFKTDAEVEAEKLDAVKVAKKELESLVDEKLQADAGANHTGLYELRGVITHQGASADSGHYTAFVKKTGHKDSKTGKTKEEDGRWWWFNDEKVSEVDAEKIETLSGGGTFQLSWILFGVIANILPQARVTLLLSSSIELFLCQRGRKRLPRQIRWIPLPR